MNQTVREFCRWVHKQNPNFGKEFRELGIRYAYLPDKRALAVAYLTPFMRKFAISKGYDPRQSRQWRDELFPQIVSEFVYENAVKEFLK